MAKLLSGMAVALALSSFGLAQGSAAQTNQRSNAAQTASSAASQTATARIAPGSVIPVQLTTTVDAKKVKTGEQVTAKVTQDLKSSDGMMLMPKDTEIDGHITQAQPRNKQDKESQVGIVFDHAMVNNSNVSYPLSIQAVISAQVFQNPNQNQNANNENAGAPAQAPSSSMPSSMPSQSQGGSARGMGGQQAAPANTPPSGTGSETPSASSQRPEITGHTQGVVGFPHMKLETPANATQPSVISSEKNNVRLENGTLMLLRVNQ